MVLCEGKRCSTSFSFLSVIEYECTGHGIECNPSRSHGGAASSGFHVSLVRGKCGSASELCRSCSEPGWEWGGWSVPGKRPPPDLEIWDQALGPPTVPGRVFRPLQLSGPCTWAGPCCASREGKPGGQPHFCCAAALPLGPHPHGQDFLHR